MAPASTASSWAVRAVRGGRPSPRLRPCGPASAIPPFSPNPALLLPPLSGARETPLRAGPAAAILWRRGAMVERSLRGATAERVREGCRGGRAPPCAGTGDQRGHSAQGTSQVVPWLCKERRNSGELGPGWPEVIREKMVSLPSRA